jgi:hypothetical protein
MAREARFRVPKEKIHWDPNQRLSFDSQKKNFIGSQIREACFWCLKEKSNGAQIAEDSAALSGQNKILLSGQIRGVNEPAGYGHVLA